MTKEQAEKEIEFLEQKISVAKELAERTPSKAQVFFSYCFLALCYVITIGGAFFLLAFGALLATKVFALLNVGPIASVLFYSLFLALVLAVVICCRTTLAISNKDKYERRIRRLELKKRIYQKEIDIANKLTN